MSDIIHLLPDHIANQIAAGEVIQRPASVVKELMENSLDAGAGSVFVHIKDAGRTLVQVIDDGKGMSETDARMAFERHATSKITAVEDLSSLRTMGFRGEALASIAAVAQVELRTKLRGAEVGTKLSISGSDLEYIEPDACNEGAVFSVKNLFFNVPARRKFLKSNETEFRNILTEFERVALVNPHIMFVLRHNDTEILNLPASTLRQRIVNVFGKKLNQRLLPVTTSTALINLEGFIGRPDATRRKGALNYFFVNGRYIRHPYFHRAVMQVYEPLAPPGETPDYFIYMTLDPSMIDVNIHPTKTEVKFENEPSIWHILSSVVRETLGKSDAVPMIDFNTEGAIDIPVYRPVGDQRPPEVRHNPAYNPFHAASQRASSRPAAAPQDWEKLYRGFENARDLPPDGLTPPEAEATPDETARDLFQHLSNSCFQYKNQYIITPLKSGLVLIDQHRAHVRILYDQYLSNVKHQRNVSQKMLFPEIIELTASEAAMIAELSDGLQGLGFDLNPLGNNSYSISGLPAGVEECNPVELLRGLVCDAMETGVGLGDSLSESLALSLARTAAIRSGKALSVEEMESVVAALFASESNRITPDGKIILSVLTDEELAKRFKG